MSNSPNLSLPYIQPSQAQKHVTHNQAIEILDAMVHLCLTELYATEPPDSPFDGQVIGVGSGASGEFAGQDGMLAYLTNGGWMFLPPRNGFKAWVETHGAFYVFQQGAWQVLLAVGISELEGLGLNTGWDLANRLAVSSPATLLSHDGAGHQLKINKSSPTDTASLLLQDGFSGRAEIGLAGDDDLSVKVSSDGAAWSTALSIDAANGDLTTRRINATEISGNAVQRDPLDTTAGRLMRADWGYGPGNILGPVTKSGGLPAGAVIENGETSTGRYTRWADGSQICEFVTPVLTCDHFSISDVFFGSAAFEWLFPAAFAEEPTLSVAARRTTGAHVHFATIASHSYGLEGAAAYLISTSDKSSGTLHITATGRWA